MSALPDPDATVHQSLQDGLALVLKAEDRGDWKAVIDWLGRHPHLAGELAGFLAAQRGIRPLVAPLRVKTTLTAVGKYELREVLGKGMGVVYHAYDPDAKREVAVKLLHPGGELSADDRARFRWEAEAVATLDDERVVRLYDFGEVDGIPYLVMPLMAGSLAKWLKELGPDRALKPRLAAELAHDIALGVHHAHQRGLIHRDLKPANILRDDAGRVRVADFGLARLTDLTATHMAGTPAYMAPEQVGTGRRLTTAVDVHAVGVILFELLAGGPPFGGENVGSVLKAVEVETAPPVRTFRPDVPRDLEAVVAKCLAKKPEHRYPSALALSEDLDNFLHGRPVQAALPNLLTDMMRAFGFRTDPQRLFTWRGLFVGSLTTLLTVGWVQAAVLLDAPPWIGWAGLACYLAQWGGILWLLLVSNRDRLRPVERVYGACHTGMWLGAVALTPAAALLHGGQVAAVFPPMLVLIGGSSALRMDGDG